MIGHCSSFPELYSSSLRADRANFPHVRFDDSWEETTEQRLIVAIVLYLQPIADSETFKCRKTDD